MSAICSYVIFRRMTPEELEQMLRDCVRYALHAHKHARPKPPDTEIRDRYFTSAADAIIRQIKLSWHIEAPDVLRKAPPLKPQSDRGHYLARKPAE